MSYYDNSPQSQWAGQPQQQPQQQQQQQQQQQNNWEHQGVTSPSRAGANGPQPQDEYAFSYQFDEVDRAYENLSKSGKGYGMGGNRRKFSPMHGPGSARRTPDFEGGRMPHGPSPRSQSVHNFDDARGSGGQNLHNFYAQQRNQPSRGTNEAEQVMQAKRRMAAQRERELRNLHTEQQYQRNALPEVPPQGANTGPSPANNSSTSSKQMSEEETRELIARQRSALYGEGPFAEQGSYVDENGSVRPGPHAPSGPPSLRGQSPMTYDNIGRKPSGPEANIHGSAGDPALMSSDPSPRPASTSSPQTTGPPNKVFDNAVGAQSRTSTSSPTGGSPPRDMTPGSKPGVSNATVAPIGTRPSGTPNSAGPGGNRSTPPQTGGWGRGTGVWGQSSGLGTQASVWG